MKRNEVDQNRSRKSFQFDTSSRHEALHQAVGNQEIKRLYERGELQAKLAVSNSDDDKEREAERIAKQILQAEQTAINEEEEGPAERSASKKPDIDADSILTSGDRSATIEGKREQRIRLLEAGGRPLSKHTRSFFESRFGRDFSDVRVHTGAKADEAARSIDAEAFTHGTDVVFRKGEYAPTTSSGKRLLAHELSHVVQQEAAVSRSIPSIQRQSDADSESEHPRFPRQRRVEISVDPKPTGNPQVQHPEKLEEVGRPIPAEITKEFLVDQKLREEDHEMRWALLFAAADLAGERLEEKSYTVPYGPLSKVLSWVKSKFGISPSDKEMRDRFINKTIEKYLQETEKKLEHMKRYYRLRRSLRQSKIPDEPVESTPDPEQTLYFKFDSTEFNDELTSEADWQYTVEQVRAYIRNHYLFAVSDETPWIHVEGYASTVGEKKYNVGLSLDRASKVREKLNSELQDLNVDFKIWVSGAGESA